MVQPLRKQSLAKYNMTSELERWRVDTIFEKEPETIAWIGDYAKAGGVFFDVGANIGIYSLYAASLNPQLQVYCFEPVQNNVTALNGNIALNSYGNIYAFQVALSEKNGLVDLFIRDARIGNSGSQIDRPVDESGETFSFVDKQKVLSFTIDSLIRDFGLPVPHFVKIDVDGRETDILRGMHVLLGDPQFRSLLVEFNSRADIAAFEPVLASYGLVPDALYNERADHSRTRRAQKDGTAVNCIFTKKMSHV